ncbi:hypothetical protein [Type-D symbiont of Plautia stali]|uniref:hypothetical protein n=1 Tax=Type-D symbiont of Plautia stali TaxID=1560356 RepID=UPI00073EC418|nr:hypothetical protein [Type-D symbiont of Plautia stali]
MLRSLFWAKGLFALLSLGSVVFAIMIYFIRGEMSFLVNRTAAVLLLLFILHERYSQQPVFRHWAMIFYWLVGAGMLTLFIVDTL